MNANVAEYLQDVSIGKYDEYISHNSFLRGLYVHVMFTT